MRFSGKPAFLSLTMSSAVRSFTLSVLEMYFFRKSSERFAFQSLMMLSTSVGVGVGAICASADDEGDEGRGVEVGSGWPSKGPAKRASAASVSKRFI